MLFVGLLSLTLCAGGPPAGTWLRVSGQTATLGGVTGCVLFVAALNHTS
jgi:hypothetical protein